MIKENIILTFTDQKKQVNSTTNNSKTIQPVQPVPGMDYKTILILILLGIIIIK